MQLDLHELETTEAREQEHPQAEAEAQPQIPFVCNFPSVFHSISPLIFMVWTIQTIPAYFLFQFWLLAPLLHLTIQQFISK